MHSNLFNSVSNLIVSFTLIPIYSFLLLLYKRRFKKFLFTKYAEKNGQKLTKVLDEIKELIRFYLSGLVLDMAFVFVLSLIGFWIVGAPHIVFLALLCALLNLVPYVGIMLAGVVSMLSTLASQNNINAVLGVLVVIAVVQLVENNFVSPKIVGSKVRLNPLATIVAVIVGGAVSGVSGMFLAIPLLAILNIIIQHIDSLRPFSYLISDIEIKDLEKGNP